MKIGLGPSFRVASGCAMLASAFVTLSFFALQTFQITLDYVRNNPTLGSTQAHMGIVSDRGHFYDGSATHVSSLPERTPGDAPWTQSEASYKQMIFCPHGLQNKAMPKGIVLLVPGTGGNASEAYKSSAYYQLLPSEGFNVCWVDIPNYSLGDMQLAAEFVVYAIKYLAPKSTSTKGKINIVSYSQGGSNVQWASTFWPSIHKLVMGHVALSPPMKGTASTILLCPVSTLAGGCQPSVLQQSSSSEYMQASKSLADKRSGAYALIPTTIVYTLMDEIVTPQVGPDASSRLIGASNIAIQAVCGIFHNPDHFSIVGDVGAFGIALDALKNGRPAKQSTIDRSYCTRTAESLGFSVGNLGNGLNFGLRTAVGDPGAQPIAPQLKQLLVRKEPPLQQYVCDRGYATSGCTRNGFKRNPTTNMLSDALEADGHGW